jgi:hypothetical protein
MKHKISLNNIESHFEQWDDGQYRCVIQTRVTVFGTWIWHVTDMQAGKGFGGFAKSEDEARASVKKKLAEFRGEG